MPKHSVTVLLTSHNRRDLTTASIRSALEHADQQLDIRVVLADAGSTDGTRKGAADLGSAVDVHDVGSETFWNTGMRIAWLRALKQPSEFYLWLNDDLVLRPGAIHDLITTYLEHAEASGNRLIVVGKTTSPGRDEITYGGYRRARGLSRLRFRRLSADEVDCDTMNGNCVLIPRCAADQVGINSTAFTHAFGDIDYGLRARRMGYRIVQAAKPVGEQERNDTALYNAARLPITMQNIRKIFFHPKGLPIREWFHFCVTHGGILWPANFVYRYVKVFSASARGG